MRRRVSLSDRQGNPHAHDAQLRRHAQLLASSNPSWREAFSEESPGQWTELQPLEKQSGRTANPGANALLRRLREERALPGQAVRKDCSRTRGSRLGETRRRSRLRRRRAAVNCVENEESREAVVGRQPTTVEVENWPLASRPVPASSPSNEFLTPLIRRGKETLRGKSGRRSQCRRRR